jgi:hypothetical protein
MTAACAISTGVNDFGGLGRDVEPVGCCAGASGRVDVIARFCQSFSPPRCSDLPQAVWNTADD